MSTNKSNPHDSHRSLVKSMSILSVGTLTSRILGFFRDIILARLLGTGLKADAFFVAFRIPNLFRDMVGEGATNAAVVPILSEYQEKENKEAFWRFVSIILALALIALSLLTILGILLAPVIVRAMAPGFIADPSKLLLTVRLTKWMFPYLVLIGLTAYSMGILFTFRSFAVPAFSPCLLNISLIVSALVASRTMQEPVFGLAIGVLIGGALQLLVQFWPLKAAGMKYYPPKTLHHPGAVRIGRLLIPRMAGSGVYQLTVLIDTFCASLASIVGQGGISAIYYANRILQCPMGIFGVAMASAILPTLSGLAQRKEVEALRKTLIFSLENIFFIMCPMTIILFLLAEPIVQVFFQRGEFGVYSTAITSSALAYYVLGLFSFGGIKILVAAFHALQDTRTPVKVAALCLGINACLNFVLMFPLKVGGIALASAISGTVDFLILFRILNKRLGNLDMGLLRYFSRVLAASVVAGVAVQGVWHYGFPLYPFLRLVLAGLTGLLAYEMVCLLLRIEQAQKIAQWIFNKK